MTLKTIQEYYPTNNTWVGFFDTDGAHHFENIEDIKNIDYWDDSPFYNDNNTISFLEYLSGDEYRRWCFGFFKVQGYFTNGDYDDFYPMIYSDDFGWEKIDVDIEDDQDIIIEPPIEEEGETYMSKIVTAFKKWHPDCGPIITNSKELEKFIGKKKK